MSAKNVTQSRMRRTVNDLVMAEMFLVQATIESATAIGDGVKELARQVSTNDEQETSPWDSIAAVLQRTAEEVMEPYSSRFRYLRIMLDSDN